MFGIAVHRHRPDPHVRFRGVALFYQRHGRPRDFSRFLRRSVPVLLDSVVVGVEQHRGFPRAQVGAGFVPGVFRPRGRAALLDQVHPVARHFDRFGGVHFGNKLAVFNGEVLRAVIREFAHIGRVNGAPVPRAADREAVGAGPVPALELLAHLCELIQGLRNLKVQLLERLRIVGERIDFKVHGQSQLFSGSNLVPGHAVPLQGVHGGGDQIFEIIVRRHFAGVVQVGVQVLHIPGGGIIPQLIRAGHEQIRVAGAAGKGCGDLVEIVCLRGDGMLHLDPRRFFELGDFRDDRFARAVLIQTDLQGRAGILFPVERPVGRRGALRRPGIRGCRGARAAAGAAGKGSGQQCRCQCQC